MQIIAINTEKYLNQRRSKLRIDQELRSSMDSEVRIKKINIIGGIKNVKRKS